MHRNLTFERAIDFARDLIRIPSSSGEEGAIAERVVRELKSLGFHEVWIDEIGNVLGRIKGCGQSPAIVLSSHLDTVGVADPAQWEFPPFAGQCAQGFLHGRGASDCKGPLALQTYAAAYFLDHPPAGNIYLAFTVMEERGSWGMAHFMENLDVRPGLVILGEATGGDICIGHRGRRELVVTLSGIPAHASSPANGRNPVDVLPAAIGALQRYAAQLDTHAVLPASTLVISAIETRPQNRNMVPEEVCVMLDWRILPGSCRKNMEHLRNFLNDELEGWFSRCRGFRIKVDEVVISQRAHTGLEWTRPVSTAAFLMDPTHPLIRTAVDLLRETTGRKPAIRPWIFGTDGSYTGGVHSIPTIGYAPGDEACAHTNHERLNLSDAAETYRCYPALIAALHRTLATECSSEITVTTAGEGLAAAAEQ
jgi:succinyl-diaminopimelate desuccinylase